MQVRLLHALYYQVSGTTFDGPNNTTISMANLKQYCKLSELPKLSRNTTAVLGAKPEGRFGVQIIPSTPVYDNENAWMMTCVVTGRKFSPIQVPAHFLAESVCDGKAYKKLMKQREEAAKNNNKFKKNKKSK